MSRGDVGAARVAAWVLTAAAVACSGCGSSDPEPSAGTGAPGKPKPGAGRPDMVAAVSSSKGAVEVDVRFELTGRPVVGQSLDIHVVMTPNIELDSLNARFTSAEGLELVKGAETSPFERPPRNGPITHTLTVIPKSDGIFYVTATVNSDSPKESVSRSYSIPIIAGLGVPELPQTAVAVPARPNPRP